MNWETGSGNDFRIWKYDRWDPFIQARDLGGLGTMDPGLRVKDGAMIGRGFDSSGNTGGSGSGPERALEAIIPSPRAQREIIPLFELPCERRPGPAEPMPTDLGRQLVRPRGTYANSPLITSPAMSVRRKSRPSKRCVKRVCSMPKRCSIVACKSCTFTGFSTMLYPKSSVRP